MRKFLLLLLLSGCQLFSPKQDIEIVEDVVSDISKKESIAKTAEDAVEDVVEDVVEDTIGFDLGLNHDHASQGATGK